MQRCISEAITLRLFGHRTFQKEVPIPEVSVALTCLRYSKEAREAGAESGRSKEVGDKIT